MVPADTESPSSGHVSSRLHRFGQPVVLRVEEALATSALSISATATGNHWPTNARECDPAREGWPGKPPPPLGEAPSGQAQHVRDRGEVLDVSLGSVEAESHGQKRIMGATCLAVANSMRSVIPAR